MTTPYATPALPSQNCFFFRNQNDSVFKFSELSRMNAARLEQRSWLIFDSTFTVQIANIKEEYLDLKPYRDGRKVLPDLSEDAEIV